MTDYDVGQGSVVEICPSCGYPLAAKPPMIVDCRRPQNHHDGAALKRAVEDRRAP